VARRSSLFSRSSCFSRSRSLVVRPARCPASISARFTHSCSVTGCIPNLPAIDWVACHPDVYSLRCSWAIRTARSLSSWGYLPCLAIACSF
jgi:hypothetical protein